MGVRRGRRSAHTDLPVLGQRTQGSLETCERLWYRESTRLGRDRAAYSQPYP